MNPEIVASNVLGYESFQALNMARVSWPSIVKMVALELFLHPHIFENYDVYCDSIRKELLRIGY